MPQRPQALGFERIWWISRPYRRRSPANPSLPNAWLEGRICPRGAGHRARTGRLVGIPKPTGSMGAICARYQIPTHACIFASILEQEPDGIAAGIRLYARCIDGCWCLALVLGVVECWCRPKDV